MPQPASALSSPHDIWPGGETWPGTGEPSAWVCTLEEVRPPVDVTGTWAFADRPNCGAGTALRLRAQQCYRSPLPVYLEEPYCERRVSIHVQAFLLNVAADHNHKAYPQATFFAAALQVAVG
jgi:hypothetical protein